MSCYFKNNNDTEVSIPKYLESASGVTYYDIKLRVHDVEWMVERRYKDFDQLNEKLIEEISISKKLLPPKKIVGNKNPTFLEQRRQQLEKYIQDLLVLFRFTMPRVLAEFLDFNKYDIIYLLQDLAKLFNESGDSLLSSKKEYSLSALELYAISERRCLPCPESIEQRSKYDFSHVLDFCSQLEILNATPVKDTSTVGGDYNSVDVPIGRSNLIPKKLCFNLNAFPNLKCLRFYGLSTENVIDIALLKSSLEQISVHNTTIMRINQVLMCDNLHKDIIILTNNIDSSSSSSCSGNSGLWSKINQLCLTGNLLTQIDSSIRMAPNIKTLILDQNRLQSIQNLSELTQLQVLSLSVNLISECIDWHLELGNLVTLNLSQNKLRKLSGLRKLLSLINLDLSCNQIEELEEVDNVSCLPILETLRLTGNPLAGSVDYRSRVLARFHDRATEIFLDSERGSQRELDTALVLSALEKSKNRQQQQRN